MGRTATSHLIPLIVADEKRQKGDDNPYRIALARALLGGDTLATMAGFDAIAPQVERIDLTGGPGWPDGSFRLGSAEGHVRRRAQGATRECGDDPWSEVTQVVVARTGTLGVDLSGVEAGGRIEGRWRHGRVKVQQRTGAFSISELSCPLRLACTYRLDGRDAGGMDLSGVLPMGPTLAETQLGTVDLDGIELTVTSCHVIFGIRHPLEHPIGYVVSDNSGQVIGAIETNGVGKRRLILPRATGERRASVTALVTLALFWDPRDLD